MAGGRKLSLDFCCLASQGILAVTVGNADASAGDDSDSSPLAAKLTTKLFVNLIGADTGEELPAANGSNGSHAPPAYSLQQQKEALLSLLPAAPFRWAQLLGSEPLQIDRFREVLERITERVHASDALALQLSRLHALDASLPSHLATPLPAPPQAAISKLTAWRQLDIANDLSSEARARLPTVPAWLASSMRIYQAEISREAVCLGVTVHLFADFPRSAAHLSLDWIHPPAKFAAGPKGPPHALEALASPAALRTANMHRGSTREVRRLPRHSMRRTHPPPFPSLLPTHTFPPSPHRHIAFFGSPLSSKWRRSSTAR